MQTFCCGNTSFICNPPYCQIWITIAFFSLFTIYVCFLRIILNKNNILLGIYLGYIFDALIIKGYYQFLVNSHISTNVYLLNNSLLAPTSAHAK